MKWHETRVKVRFHEVDSYHVAWHGHYVAWMELGRNELTAPFGLDAAQISAAGYLAPVVSLELKYLKPARFGDLLTIQATLEKTETATLAFAIRIIGPDGKPCAAGKTIHAFTDMNGELQYTLPLIIRERVERLAAWLEEE